MRFETAKKEENMHRTVSTWTEFKQHWDGLLNFLMEGECVPFDYPMPSIERVIAEARDDKDANIGSGSKGDKLDMESHAEHFRGLPLEEAVHAPFSIAHYSLRNFDVPGRMF